MESDGRANTVGIESQIHVEQERAKSIDHAGPLKGKEAMMDMPNSPGITMYTTRFCPYCVRARVLLETKGVDFKDIAVDGNPGLHLEMMEKSKRHSVPQIWIGNRHIGGCDELYQLEHQGELDLLLSELSYE